MRHLHTFLLPSSHSKRGFLLATLFASLSVSALAAGGADTYTVQALTIPRNAFSGQASAINDSGVSAGWYQTSNGWTAVSWSADNQLTRLGTLPGLPSALANDINQSGTVVGFAFTSDFLASRAFIWSSDTGMQPLVDLGGNASLAQAINADGTTIGWSYDAVGVLHAVKWDASGFLTDLNHREQSVKRSTSTTRVMSSAGSSPQVGPPPTPTCGDTKVQRSTLERSAARGARPSA
jgi:probable HAF family extracellular repeat protein